MRITNKIMNNNSLDNINKNKVYLDKLNTELASGKKITRPSDDPIVAIRALKLRGSLTEVTQYHEKNVEDANAWMRATQDAIESTKGILTSMKAEFTQGATGTNTTESRKAILQELKALRDQIYDDGNAEYAGRTVFTGFRTNTKLTFQDSDFNHEQKYDYNITQTFTAADMDEVAYVSGKVTSSEVVNAATGTKVEQKVKSETFSRIRLAYDDLDANKKITSINIGAKTVTVKTIKATDTNYPDCAYDVADDEVNYNPTTGELIFSKGAAAKMKALTDDQEVTVSYSKKSWSTGDIRPEHYFECDCTDKNGNTIEYRENAEQDIKYDISSNQELKVNSNATDIYFHGIGRDIDEMLAAIEDVNKAEEKVDTLKAKLEKATDPTEKEKIKNALDAANKELSLVKDKMQKMFEHGQTTFGNYLDKVTLAGTEVGTRIQRLELVQNRLLNLKTTAKELADENENVEVTDVAINASEAKLSYNAALMATGQISQQTLLSYI